MQSKIAFKKILFAFIIAGTAFALIIILFSTIDLPVHGFFVKSVPLINSQATQNSINNKPVKSVSKISLPKQIITPATPIDWGLPVRLQIPKIKVDVALESVGLTQGAVGVPKDIANAAWYNLGPRPGASGSAVITGHYGWWKNGALGVFNNLNKLRKGDKIYVKDRKGTTVNFIAREFKIYGENEIVPDIFFSNDGKSHLNLITCEGVWDKVSKSYSKRLVVFADME